jgi:hypothetical protein
MSAESSEALAIERLLPDLEAKGYEVFVNPQRSILPRFFAGYEPDIIALRGDSKIAIEVKHHTVGVDQRLREIAQRFEGHPDWKFQIIWVSPATDPKYPSRQSTSTIGQKLDEVKGLVANGHFDAAFLLGWAVLEATARAAVDREFDRPQTPGRVVETLAARGILTPDEADMLRPLVEIRNRLIHGELNVAVTDVVAKQFVQLLESTLATTLH